jgi:hypothetical protein
MSTTFESDWENTRLKEQLAAKDDEIRELVTSDNKVVADLSRYVKHSNRKSPTRMMRIVQHAR